jgi:nucleotide-binding universal stress UspA family protein
MKPFNSILVPTDFSEHSEEALRVAADLAQRYAATISLVHVYEPVQYVMPEGYFFTPEQITHLDSALRAQLAKAGRALGDSNTTRVESHLLEGLVFAEIVRFAREHGSDLIVMGTHGRTGIKHALIGSVAERVTRTAPCPVLVVRALEKNP